MFHTTNFSFIKLSTLAYDLFNVKLSCTLLPFLQRFQNKTQKLQIPEYVDLPAKVPGGIYTDLMRNKIIDDIFYGYNDDNYKWVPRQNWTYYRNFTGIKLRSYFKTYALLTYLPFQLVRIFSAKKILI